jgi:hypothetical protein
MNRLTAAVSAACTLGLFVVGLALATPQPHASAYSESRPESPDARWLPRSESLPADEISDAPYAPAAQSLDMWISLVEDGERVPSVVSTTQEVWVVTDYVDAQGEQFLVEMRDLAGIVVVRTPVYLDGTGRASVPIVITDFVSSYVAQLDASAEDSQGNCLSPACAAVQLLEEASLYCESAPPPPDTWPPTTPTAVPGQPTPTPGTDLWRLWFDAQLGLISSAQSATSEVTRTTQAMMNLPDVADSNLRSALMNAQSQLTHAYAVLEEAKALINPQESRPTPTATAVPPGRPDPVAGCERINAALAAVRSGTESLAPVIAASADVADWRLPPTGARWLGERFDGCVRLKVDLLPFVGGRPQTSPVKSAFWSVGEPGSARLMFPADDLVDRDLAGTLGLRILNDASAIYADSVTVPGINQEALISAFVTDANCIPLDGVDIGFAVSPELAGSVDPMTTTVVNGSAFTTFHAGSDAVNNGLVTGFVSSGEPGQPSGAAGTATFQVIGPTDNIDFRMSQARTINLASNGRLAFSAQLKDAHFRGVADGTRVVVTIPEADPIVMVYERENTARPRPGQPAPTPEIVVLGKSLEMLTLNSMTQLGQPEDPGFVHNGPFLMCTDIGSATVSGEADGVVESTDDTNGLKTIRCVRRYGVYMPRVMKLYDANEIRTPRAPIETSTPSATPPSVSVGG